VSSRRADAPPDDLHEWISFEDPDEHRTWLFDATYLRSNYTCIYGCGCKGILDEPAPELQLGCCSFGAHFAERFNMKRTEARDFFDELTALSEKELKRAGEFTLPGLSLIHI